MVKYPLAYNPILEYSGQIERGEVIVCRKIKIVIEKLCRDIVDSSSEYEYSPRRANHILEFSENYCKHSKGKWGGQSVVLEIWEKALLAAAFGFVHKVDGVRKYREVLLVVARKNGKSTLASIVGLYLMIGDGEPGAEIYAVATKRDQAKIIWSEAKRMVQKSPALFRNRRNPHGKIKTLVGELCSDYNDSSFKPLGSDSDTLDGLNVHGALLDECHAWTAAMRALYDVVVDGVTAREQPMIFETTTAGTVRNGVYDDLYDESERTINGWNDPDGYHNDHFLPWIYELDARKEWTDPNCWRKANPGLGTIKSIEQLRDKVSKASANEKLVRNLLCKDFNIPETTGEAWLSFEILDNRKKFDIKKIKPRYGIAGVDLSSTTDLTAAVVLFMVPNDIHIYVLSMFWLPEELFEQRVKEDKIPYDLWADQGLLRLCPGRKIDHHMVTEWFTEVQNEMDCYLYAGGYDAWSAQYFVQDLEETFGQGVFHPVQQTMKILSNPMKQLGADLASNIIVYDNNPILKWCMANTAQVEDKNGNIKPAKTSSTRKRIDGFAALLDAYIVLLDNLSDYSAMI